MSEKGQEFLHDWGMIYGIKSYNLEFCEHCIFGKQMRVQFTTRFDKSSEFLQLINFDIFGSVPTMSINGARCCMTFVDNYSRRVWLYFLKYKSKYYDKFKEFKE